MVFAVFFSKREDMAIQTDLHSGVGILQRWFCILRIACLDVGWYERD
jgi:hypothetical protein